MNCLICQREKKLTKHHFIPSSRHKNKKTISRHGKDKLQETLQVCRECHNQLHACISEKEMDENFHDFEKLCNHPEIKKFREWIIKHQPQGKIKVKRAKSKYRR